MANIGTLAVNVIARTGKFIAGMQTARKSINGFAMQAKSAATSTAGFAGGLLALGAGAGLAALTKNAFESIDATAKLSDKLNIGTEDMIAFQHAGELAGVGTDQLSRGLEKFVRNIGDVRAGSGAAAATFEMLGLSADSLANMDTGEALGLVADQINKLPTAADKASAATKIFGKSGGDMLALLAGGSEGLEAAREKMEELGLSFSRLDAAKVEQANDAITDMKGSFMGAFQTLAIEFAPAVVALAEKITSLVASGDGIKAWMPTFGGVAQIIGVVADVVDVFHDGFLALSAGVTKAVSLTLIPLQYLYEATTALMNLVGMDVDTTFFATMREELDALANEQWEEAKTAFMEPPPSSGIQKMLEDVTKSTNEAAAAMTEAKKPIEDFMGAFEANEAVTGFTDKLQEQIDTFGMSSREAEISKLASAGASAEFLNMALALDQELTAKEASAAASEKLRAELESLASEGVSLTESLRTPAEEFEATIDDLLGLLNVGAINDETFRRAAEKAKSEFADSIAMPTVPTGAAAVDARSTEGISRMRNQNKDPMKDSLKVAEKQLETQVAQRVLLGTIAKTISSDKLEGVSIP